MISVVKKLWLVSGQPGSRIDFVAGWISTLPSFYTHGWCIDPYTGQSSGRMRLTKQLSEGSHFESLIESLCIKIEPNNSHAESWVGAWHPCAVNGIDKYLGQGLEIVHIKPRQQDLSKIFWENRVKTLITKNSIDSYIKQSPDYAQLSIDNEARTLYFRQQLEQNVIDIEPEPQYPHINLDYSDLFVPNGSQYLCDKLSLTAYQFHHDLWNHMLLLADSPQQIMVWGQCWQQQDWPINSCVTQPMPHN